MKQTLSFTRCQIERVVHRSDYQVDAEFWMPVTPISPGFPTRWFCCQAWIRDGKPEIQARGTNMTPEQAAIVAAGIGMALDWITEELAE